MYMKITVYVDHSENKGLVTNRPNIFVHRNGCILKASDNK